MFKIELFICIKIYLALITCNGWWAIKPNHCFNCVKTNDWNEIELLVLERNYWNNLTVCKQNNSDSFKYIIKKLCIDKSYIKYICTNQIWHLIAHKSWYTKKSNQHGALRNVKFTIFLRSTLTQSGSTWSDTINESNRTVWPFNCEWINGWYWIDLFVLPINTWNHVTLCKPLSNVEKIMTVI